MATERGILFSGEMVRAILDGRKGQTRRVMKPQPTSDLGWITDWGWTFFTPPKHISGRGRRPMEGPGEIFLPCPYTLEQRLWVRETWQDYCPIWNGGWCGCGSQEMIERTHKPVYKATETERIPLRWKPSIFMPRWASRITLEITGVKVERIQDISDDDARAEGACCAYDCDGQMCAFNNIWDSINGKRPGCSWADNPWCWAISFRRIKP